MTEYAEVHIRWLSSAEGGRSTPVQFGGEASLRYRPHFRVGEAGEYLGVAFLSGDPAIGVPGNEGSAIVVLIYTETGVDYSPLVPGAIFDVLEGPEVVGRGTVRRRWQNDATSTPGSAG